MKYFLGILFYGLAVVSYSQTKKIDSLQLLSDQAQGIPQVDALNDLAFELLPYDNAKARNAAKEALRLSKAINFGSGKAKSLIFIGVSEWGLGNRAYSFAALNESIDVARRIRANALIGYAFTYLAGNYQNSNKMDSARYCYDQAYALLKDLSQPFYLSVLYLQLAEFHQTANEKEKQLAYLKKSWAIREKLKDKRFLVEAGERIANYYTEFGNYSEASAYLLRAQKALGKDTVDNEEINKIYKARANIRINEGNYSEAFQLFGKAKRYYEKTANQKQLILIQSEIGYIFMDVANFELSLKNYLEALALAEKNKFEPEQTKILFRIAWVYYQLKQDKQAEGFIMKSFALAKANSLKTYEGYALNLLGLLADRKNNNGEALTYFNEALAIRKSLNNSNAIASTLLNIGILLEEDEKLDQALDYDLQSLAIEESSGHSLGIANCYQSLGQLYTKRREFGKAANFLEKAEALTKKINAGSILLDVLKNKRDLFLAQAKYKEGITYSLQYDNLKDSIFNQDMGSRINTLQNMFQLEQKENTILILNQQRELQRKELEIKDARLKSQTVIIIIVSVSFIILAAIAYSIFYYYKRVRTLNKEISERNEEIQAQSEELTESNSSLSLLNQEILEQNEEIQAQASELTEANSVLHKLNREISEQKEEIQAQAEELTESNQLISNINETLEQRIEERTTELKQAYKELDTFFYRSSHDFRRPLTTFMGLAEVAKITVKDSVALELFSKVNETARNLDKMLMKLHSISELGDQELLFKEIGIHELMLRKADLFKDELLQKNIRIDIEADPKLTLVSSPSLIKIILVNLIENSISFKCEKEQAQITLKAYPHEGTIVLEIQDNGQGIELEYQRRVFEMYFRAHETSKGNGLGLYIVKKAAERLKAKIAIHSVVNKGTKITIAFPVASNG